jgi:PIN domain nuclease of toxin-antitoxin system
MGQNVSLYDAKTRLSGLVDEAAAIWEIAIKRRLGKLVFSGSPLLALRRNGFFELAILPVDARRWRAG